MVTEKTLITLNKFSSLQSLSHLSFNVIRQCNDSKNEIDELINDD